MQGHEIKEIIQNIPSLVSSFKGIYSIDTLPVSLEKRTFIISNTDVQSGQGKHWICFARIDKGIEVFDSLGFTEEKKKLLQKYCKFLRFKVLKFNDTRVQSFTSPSCGLFALYFAIHRFGNLDLGFKTLLNEIFETNTNLNEIQVQDFIKQFLK